MLVLHVDVVELGHNDGVVEADLIDKRDIGVTKSSSCTIVFLRNGAGRDTYGVLAQALDDVVEVGAGLFTVDRRVQTVEVLLVRKDVLRGVLLDLGRGQALLPAHHLRRLPLEASVHCGCASKNFKI